MLRILQLAMIMVLGTAWFFKANAHEVPHVHSHVSGWTVICDDKSCLHGTIIISEESPDYFVEVIFLTRKLPPQPKCFYKDIGLFFRVPNFGLKEQLVSFTIGGIDWTYKEPARCTTDYCQTALTKINTKLRELLASSMEMSVAFSTSTESAHSMTLELADLSKTLCLETKQ